MTTAPLFLSSSSNPLFSFLFFPSSGFRSCSRGIYSLFRSEFFSIAGHTNSVDFGFPSKKGLFQSFRFTGYCTVSKKSQAQLQHDMRISYWCFFVDNGCPIWHLLRLQTEPKKKQAGVAYSTLLLYHPGDEIIHK